jgi:hypothetical protein
MTKDNILKLFLIEKFNSITFKLNKAFVNKNNKNYSPLDKIDFEIIFTTDDFEFLEYGVYYQGLKFKCLYFRTPPVGNWEIYTPDCPELKTIQMYS